MKEAAGEANLTVIAIILIGVVAAVATPLIASMMGGITKKSCCENYGGYMDGTTCKVDNPRTGASSVVAESSYYDSANKKCKGA